MEKHAMTAEIHRLRTHVPSGGVVYISASNGLIEVLWRDGSRSGRLAVVAFPDVASVIGKALAKHYGAQFEEGVHGMVRPTGR